eukprot:403348864
MQKTSTNTTATANVNNNTNTATNNNQQATTGAKTTTATNNTTINTNNPTNQTANTQQAATNQTKTTVDASKTIQQNATDTSKVTTNTIQQASTNNTGNIATQQNTVETTGTNQNVGANQTQQKQSTTTATNNATGNVNNSATSTTNANQQQNATTKPSTGTNQTNPTTQTSTNNTNNQSTTQWQQSKPKTEQEQLIELRTQVNEMIDKYNKDMQNYEYIRQKELSEQNFEIYEESVKKASQEVLTEEQQKIQSLKQQVVLKRSELSQKKLNNQLVQSSLEQEQRAILNDYQVQMDKDLAQNQAMLKDLQAQMPSMKQDYLMQKKAVQDLDVKVMTNQDLIRDRQEYLKTQDVAIQALKDKITKLEPFQQKVNQAIASNPQGKVSKVQLLELQKELDLIVGTQTSTSQALLDKISNKILSDLQKQRDIQQQIVNSTVKTLIKQEEEQFKKVIEELKPVTAQVLHNQDKIKELETLVQQRDQQLELIKLDNQGIEQSIQENILRDQFQRSQAAQQQEDEEVDLENDEHDGDIEYLQQQQVLRHQRNKLIEKDLEMDQKLEEALSSQSSTFFIVWLVLLAFGGYTYLTIKGQSMSGVYAQLW